MKRIITGCLILLLTATFALADQSQTYKNITITSLATGNCLTNASGKITDTGAPCIATVNGWPGGRLTLTSAVPVMVADASAQTTIYYDTYLSNAVPVSGISLAIGSNEISVILDTSNDLSGKVYDIFAINVSGTLTLCTGPAWSTSPASGFGGSRGTGAGTSELQLSSGVWTNKNSLPHCYNNSVDKGAISANAGTYLGSFYATANGQTGMIFHPASASGGSTSAGMFLYNAYNRVLLTSVSLDNKSSWTYALTAWTTLDASTSNRVSMLDGLAQSVVYGMAAAGTSSPGNVSCVIGLDLNSASATPVTDAGANSITGTTIVSSGSFAPTLGLNYVQGMQRQSSANTGTYYGSGLASQEEYVTIGAML